MGVPRPHPRSRIHPSDRPGPLWRRLHGQLGVERVSGHPGPHLRPPLRARLPARPRGGRECRAARARGHLPPEARGGRFEGRRGGAHAAPAAVQRQAHCLRGRGAGVADGGARPGAAGLSGDGVRRRAEGGRFHAPADSALSIARERDRRRDGLHFRARRRVQERPAPRVDEGAAGRRLRRRVRRLRRAARARSGYSRPQRGGRAHPHRHRLAGLGLVRARDQGRQARHRAGRWQHGDGLLPLGAAARWRRREGHRAQRLRRNESVTLGKGRRAARRHPDHQHARAESLCA